MGDEETEVTLPFVARLDSHWRDKDTNPATKPLTQNVFYLQDAQGQKKVELRMANQWLA